MHLIGVVIRIYHGALSPELQKTTSNPVSTVAKLFAGHNMHSCLSCSYPDIHSVGFINECINNKIQISETFSSPANTYAGLENFSGIKIHSVTGLTFDVIALNSVMQR